MESIHSKLNTSLLIILIVLVGVGVYIFSPKNNSNQEIAEISQIQEIKTSAPSDSGATASNLLSYTNSELGFSFEFPQKYESVKTFQNSQIGQPSSIIRSEEKGKSFYGYLSRDVDNIFYFGGLTTDYSASHGGSIGISNECPAWNKVNKFGQKYNFSEFVDIDGYYGEGTWYIAYFDFNKSGFPCLGFAAKASNTLTKDEFLTVVDSVKIY